MPTIDNTNWSPKPCVQVLLSQVCDISEHKNIYSKNPKGFLYMNDQFFKPSFFFHFGIPIYVS